jgi:hypothetical protein
MSVCNGGLNEVGVMATVSLPALGALTGELAVGCIFVTMMAVRLPLPLERCA